MPSSPSPAPLTVVVTRTTLGVTLLAHSDVGICALLFGDRPADVRNEFRARFPSRTYVERPLDEDPLAQRTCAALDASPNETAAARSALPLDLHGTPFQRTVWRALRTIPAGKTTSYTELAERIKHPAAVRAVAQACAANPVAVLVPCHRVVRRDGSLSGYRWGLDRKAHLLTLEGASVTDNKKRPVSN